MPWSSSVSQLMVACFQTLDAYVDERNAEQEAAGVNSYWNDCPYNRAISVLRKTADAGGVATGEAILQRS